MFWNHWIYSLQHTSFLLLLLFFESNDFRRERGDYKVRRLFNQKENDLDVDGGLKVRILGIWEYASL